MWVVNRRRATTNWMVKASRLLLPTKTAMFVGQVGLESQKAALDLNWQKYMGDGLQQEVLLVFVVSE